MYSFYLPPEAWQAPFALEGQEARHLITVLRAKPGDALRLFDGLGREGRFILEHYDRNRAYLAPVEQELSSRPECRIHLALGWNKSSRRNWILEKSVELHTAGIIFWQAARSQGRVPEQPKKTWQDQCVASAKQCGNPWLPQLETMTGGAEELIARSTDYMHRIVLWEDRTATDMFNPSILGGRGDMILVLGPEGGLTPDEVTLFKSSGFRVQSLGRSILRWETAALLCLALLYWQTQT